MRKIESLPHIAGLLAGVALVAFAPVAAQAQTTPAETPAANAEATDAACDRTR